MDKQKCKKDSTKCCEKKLQSKIKGGIILSERQSKCYVIHPSLSTTNNKTATKNGRGCKSRKGKGKLMQSDAWRDRFWNLKNQETKLVSGKYRKQKIAELTLNTSTRKGVADGMLSRNSNGNNSEK